MDIVIIGSGNVATALGRKLNKAGHKIIQVLSRNPITAAALAREWNADATTDFNRINTEADIYIIAVPDGAVKEIVTQFHLTGKVVAHTAASVSMDLLKSITDNYGVFYPLQSLRKEIDTEIIPIYTEAANEMTKKVLDGLAHSIGNNGVPSANSEQRMKLHVAAVVVNNFTNHIFSLAEEYCKKEGIDFKTLLPLINNTVDRMSSASPSKMQTGPAARKDFDTIAKHEALLQNHPKLLRLYKFLTDSIVNNNTEQ